MTEIIELEPGREIIVTADNRVDTIWMQMRANKGSLGLQLTRKQAMELRRALFNAVYPTT